MRRNSGSEDNDPKREASDETPYMVKWDLTNASPAYVLIDLVVKYYYYYTTIIEKSRESREQVKGVLTTMASPHGSLALYHFWIYGAATTQELIHIYKTSKQTLNLILLKLERLGFIRRACELNRPKGKHGQISWIYILSIADSQAAIDAQLRYNEIIKKEQRENRELRKERRRLAAEETRRKAEAKDLLRDVKVQTIITQYSKLFEKKKKPIPFTDITQKLKSVGLGDYTYLELACELEEKGIPTGYYINGELDPTAKIPPKILEIRKRREARYDI